MLWLFVLFSCGMESQGDDMAVAVAVVRYELGVGRNDGCCWRCEERCRRVMMWLLTPWS